MKKIAKTILKSILFFIGWAVLTTLLPLPNTNNPAIWRIWAEIIPLFSIIVFSIIFWMIEKKQVKLDLFGNPTMGLRVGVIGGIFWLGCTIIILYLIGVIRFNGSNHISMLPIWIFAAILNVVMQELLVRGYLYQMIKQKHNMVAATIVTTALFTALHGGAFEAGLIPVLNVATMSLLMTVVLECTGSVIAPIIMHTIWNVVGAIIFGGVSLADDYPHLLNITFSGNDVLSGGLCKIEGSIVVLIMNILMMCIIFTLRNKKRL